MFFLLQCFLLFHLVFGGSECPPREDIYPCICLKWPIGRKKMETTLICHNLENDSSLSVLDPALINMEIDKFLLYDSFWQMDSKKSQDSRVPVNVLNGYKIKEVEIVDSTMSSFACPKETTCGTNYLKRLTSINSTLSDRMSCNNDALSLNAWISCPGIVEYLELSNGLPQHLDNTLKSEFFPQSMTKLKELHLPHNKISRIEKRTFTIHKFPALVTLNLSHNLIRDIRLLFSSPMIIKHLDLSHNTFRSVVDFTNLPHLESLKLVNTGLTTIMENDWIQRPLGLKHIDLSSNTLKCECSGFKWVNSTFHINAVLLGACDNPPEVKGMKLRKASRKLNERCNEKGEILASKIKKGR